MSDLSKLNNAELTNYYNLFKHGKDKTKRFEQNKIHNTDLKFLYHLVRLLNECEQLLKFGTLDLRQNNEQLKAIRRGEVPEEDIRKWASDKEKQLEKLYTETKLPAKPNETQLKELLLRCLEHHYGNLEKAIVVPDRYYHLLTQIKDMVNEVV
jgi:uncharacterized protein